MIYSSVLQLIGNTPLVELCNIKRKYNLKARIVAKIESFNPGGSAKDRIALSMVEDA
ncbi:MAG: pyridoxal-phosphate dependent enzyme, partial [Bacteroidaceae bacterium]|nr:pyridoxal-phosphate dependent enzyme [Bacteroidaceae bacterium]